MSQFVLHFTNVDAPMRSFGTAQEAVDAGRKAGFEFSVLRTDPGQPAVYAAVWTVFGGLRTTSFFK